MNKLQNSASKLGLAAAFVAMASANSFGQAVIEDTLLYSNTVNPTGDVFTFGNGLEVGDQINLSAAGNALGYQVKSFSFETFGENVGGSATGTVRFYSADSQTGTNINQLELLTAAFAIGDGFQTHTVNIPADGSGNFFQVGDNGTFFWTVEFGGVDGAGSLGLTISNPPTVGTSFNDYVEFSSPGQIASASFKQFTSGDPANFTAVVNGDLTVPEPTVLSLGLVGGLAFLRMRRRK